jgi:hypothetical protein
MAHHSLDMLLDAPPLLDGIRIQHLISFIHTYFTIQQHSIIVPETYELNVQVFMGIELLLLIMGKCNVAGYNSSWFCNLNNSKFKNVFRV